MIRAYTSDLTLEKALLQEATAFASGVSYIDYRYTVTGHIDTREWQYGVYFFMI
jgi:hypothetical protein